MSRKIPNKTAKSREKPSMVVFTVDAKSLDYNTKDSLMLYRVVYRGRLGAMAVLLLCLSFFVQNTDVARAFEGEEGAPSAAESIVVEGDTSNDALIEDSNLTETVSEELDEATNDTEEVTDTELLPEDNTETEAGGEAEPASEYLEDGSQAETADNDTSSDILQESDSESDIEEEFSDEAGLLDSEDDIFITTENATSADMLGEAVAVAYSDDSFSFNKNDCTELASGSFYCQKPTENTLEDALFAAPDSDGDLEIFLVKEGVEVQITSNQTDDAAPFYDQNSNSIVWHRLIDDRYQIVAFDIETGEEEVLTSTKENNMEPNRQGKYTVWQRWVDGGWNIVLHDGRSELQITKTTSHNVAPYIHGTLVVWNRHDQVNERTIEMYDLATETYVTIEDPEGMSVSNPRMVFVYDSIHPNGDIVTRGYDMLAKKFIDLDTLPRSLPEELPESDGTGETRALIQSKPGGKSEIEELTTESVATSTPEIEPAPAEVVATSTVAAPAMTDIPTYPDLVLDLTEAVPTTEEPPIVTPQELQIEPLEVTSEILPEPEQVVEFVMPQ